MNIKSFFMTLVQLLFSLFMYALSIFYFGLALSPAAFIFFKIWARAESLNVWMRSLSIGFSLGLGYFVFGLSLVVLSGLTRAILGLRLREGNHKIFSFEAIKWAFVSSLYLLVNFTFIDFILLTPFANLLQRLLGARLGKNVQINSKFIFDATLLEIGDNTVVGGGAIIIGHVVERGVLKLKKVKIGKNVTIGSHATIMPGCEIGDNAIIGAGAVLLKNTKIEPHSMWYGVPAENIRDRRSQGKDE